MPRTSIPDSELRAFARSYSTTREDEALAARGDFLQAFPLSSLKTLTLDEYVIGKGTASFCACVEAKTRAWAYIQGATSFKFGIYFGRTKSDSAKKYRFTNKFGKSEAEAFKNVKAALLKLVKAGEDLDFQTIDENPLSQMFKAKILSLYFPEKFFNVCSSEHLEMMAGELGISERQYVSESQHLLVEFKNKNRLTRNWSNPRYMEFLYGRFLPSHKTTPATGTIEKPKSPSKRRVNFAELQEGWAEIGKLSEEFALAWERKRLAATKFPELAAKIADRRDRPAYGYDFRSYTAPGQERYIEVKSVGKEKGGYRFFLSENEKSTSNSTQCRDDYYFYLVFYGSDKKPERVDAVRAIELYPKALVEACAFRVRFSVD
ncbi:MAG: DUF3883 domain-containing protein [Rhodocyclaceae bacterium]|nr:DUF3883 domain-containing protein [Rhodocyclaceae bacterium]